MLSEPLELNRIRIDRDFTYEELAQEIRRITRRPISAQSVYRILTTPNVKVNDRTLETIKRFLARYNKREAA